MEWYKMFNTSCFIAVFSCMHSLGYSMLSICAALLVLVVLEVRHSLSEKLYKLFNTFVYRHSEFITVINPDVYS